MADRIEFVMRVSRYHGIFLLLVFLSTQAWGFAPGNEFVLQGKDTAQPAEPPIVEKSTTGNRQSEEKASPAENATDNQPDDLQQADQQQTDQEKARQAVELPWERERENRIPKLTKLNERELLADVSEEEYLSIQDYVPLNQQNQHLFAKLLFRVPQFGLDNLMRLSKVNAKHELDTLENESGFHRLKIFEVEGKARQWEQRKLVDEVGELFDLSNYYKVKIQTSQNQNIIVYCLEIPEAWKANQKISEFASFEGLFINVTWSKEKTPILNFVAERVRWSPKIKSSLVSSKGPALLGSAGFDLGLLDKLKARNKKRLDGEDTETFYQMLAAAKIVANSRNEPNWQEEVARFDLIETLSKPDQQHGRLSIIRLQVRNVTRVKVEEEYIRKRIGIEEYYQLDGFVKFDSSIKYKGKDGETGAVFKDKYPVCVCVNRLPAGWEPGSNQKYSATFPAFFFKVWVYPSGFQNQFSDEALQQSPLLIGLDPISFQEVSESINWTAIGLASVLGIGLISIWTSYYIGKARKERGATQFRLPSKVDQDLLPDVQPATEDERPVPGMPVITESSDP